MSASGECGAEQWLTRMVDAGIEASVQSYSAMVNAFARAGDAAGAERWLEKTPTNERLQGVRDCY